MDSFTDFRCLICYHEGDDETFSPKSGSGKYDLECPECLNNDGEYIEKIHAHERIAAYSEAG
jgi:hypothetical protein